MRKKNIRNVEENDKQIKKTETLSDAIANMCTRKFAQCIYLAAMKYGKLGL